MIVLIDKVCDYVCYWHLEFVVMKMMYMWILLYH